MDPASRGLFTQWGYERKLSEELMVINSSCPRVLFVPFGVKKDGFMVCANTYSLAPTEFIAKFVSA